MADGHLYLVAVLESGKQPWRLNLLRILLPPYSCSSSHQSWKYLETLRQAFPNIKMISLTAAPPYEGGPTL